MASRSRGAGTWMAIGAVGAALLAGCVSTRPFEAGLAGDFELGRAGRHAVAIMRSGPPLWVTYSSFHIPEGDAQARFGPAHRCADARVKVRLDGGIRDEDGLVADICGAALRTLDYLAREAGPVDLKVGMHVVAEGREASRWTIAVGLAPRLSLAVPMHPDRQRMLGLVIDIVAHEGSHVVDRVLGAEQALTVEGEVQAHRHALCARLEVTGQLHRSGVPVLPVVDGGSESFRRSVEGGLRVLHETAPLFEGRYYVVAGSAAAATIMQRCRQGATADGVPGIRTERPAPR